MKPALAPHDPVAHDLAAHAAETRARELRGTSIWEPVATIARPPVVVTIPIERQMIAIITRPVGATEGHRLGNDRKEQDLRALFDTLTPVESLTLERRLDAARRDDALYQTFQRLVVERRVRLLAYLADHRRRAASRR